MIYLLGRRVGERLHWYQDAEALLGPVLGNFWVDYLADPILWPFLRVPAFRRGYEDGFKHVA